MTKTKKEKVDLSILDTPDVPSVNETSDKAIVATSFGDIVMSVMTEAQFSILNGRTPKHLIKRRPGKGGKTFSYVPHGYVTAKLNQAFGFDWNFEVLPNGKGDYFQVMEALEVERANGNKSTTPMSIIVMGRLTVRIRDPRDMTRVIATITKDSTGEKEYVPGMSWGGMIKSAESDAFKKAASRLGVALDLYWQDADEDYDEGTEKKVKDLAASGMAKPEIARTLDVPLAKVLSILKNGESQ